MSCWSLTRLSLNRFSLRRSLSAVVATVAMAVAPLARPVHADVTLPNIFGNHMVLQQAQKNKVWGKASVGEEVIVKIESQSHKTTADDKGLWQVMLDPLPVGGPYKLSVEGRNYTIEFSDVLVGEVWICSGQSNMQWSVNQVNSPDLEKLSAHHPKLRMINFPQVGSQDPIWSHDRQWQTCTPENVGAFSAVGYFFGRQLEQSLDVPIGMINNAWGGSSCEAWINRETLTADPQYQPLMERWAAMEKEYSDLKSSQEATEQKLKQLEGAMRGNARPGNIYNGVLKSHLGYGIRGAIWYQGESNAGRAYQYRELFPLMVSSWRKEWNQGDFPFYWVQLADFKAEKPEPAESDWAELREAQTMAMKKLPHSGQAVIIDIGEGKDIHPMNKVDVGMRLARWALANEYGKKIAYRSPEYKWMEKAGNKIVVSFDYVDKWRPFDVAEPRGFAIAGEDKKFVWASAKIVDGNKIEVWSDQVPAPVAVRYAWADNPVCNMYSTSGLPLTPFRTDEWPGVTAEAK